MKILALDLGKYKSVGCDYEQQSGAHEFETVATKPQGLHDLLVERQPDRVVIEICSISGWVCDLVRALGKGSPWQDRCRSETGRFPPLRRRSRAGNCLVRASA